MESGVIVGIDHGGTTTTALVFDPESGQKRSSVSVSMPKQTPAVGWVEHAPEDFLNSGNEAANKALADADLKWNDVSAIGVANQGETSMAWSARSGEPLGPAISWEDRRTADICAELANKGVDALIRERTGIHLDPYFSASKFKWLLMNDLDVRAALLDGGVRFGGTDAYVIHRLTGGAVHATDAATASRMALFNLRGVHWDTDLLQAFDIELNMMPEIRPTCGDFGVVRHPDVDSHSVRITADAVDAHAALFAQGCWDATTVKATYGTGAFIEVNTGKEPVTPDGKLPVFIGWDLGDGPDYTVEGGVFSVGSAIDWTVRMGLLPSVQAIEGLANSVSDAGGVTMVPCLTGLSAPHWKSDARAAIMGLGLDTETGHIARALLDGIAFRCAEVIIALDQKLGGGIGEVKADGGPTRNKYLMQRQADILGMPVSVSLEPDMTGLGAALLAAIGAGAMTLDDVREMKRDATVYEPAMAADVREALWAGWNQSIALIRGRASP